VSLRYLAIVHSSYHIRLLEENKYFYPKLIILDVGKRKDFDADSFKDGGYVHIGSEFSAFRADFSMLPPRYYRRIRSIIQQCDPGRIVIFNNAKPLSHFILHSFDLKKIELWEDGLNHYLPIVYDFRFYFRSAVKILLGYYPKGIFDQSYMAALIKIRDRFIMRNLAFHRLTPLPNGKIFIGQPVVEDGILGGKVYLPIVSFFLNLGFKYLPHPREEGVTLGGEVIDTEFSAEDYIARHGCASCVSVFSTVNININVKQNIFLARLLGLEDISLSLDPIARSGAISMPKDMAELKAIL